MRVAYFVNQYPAVSHTFIRREILAMEALGVSVVRIAIRAGAGLVDEKDLAEAAKTRFLLQAGFGELLRSLVRTFIMTPAALAAILLQAIRMGRRAEGGARKQLIYVAEAILLADWCRQERVDHIHAHFGTNSAAIAMFASRLSQIPYSFTVHGPEEFQKAASLSLDEKLRYSVFAACVSSFGRAQLMQWSPPDLWSKIEVVHCGLDGAFLNVPATECPATRRFVCVGRLCVEKAQRVLVSAVAALRDAGQDCEIVLVGDGPVRSEIEAEIARANLGMSIKLIGSASSDRVKAEIERARALILPSFSENLPVVIMEAMALNRPVISTFVAGIPELVESGRTGWLVPAGDHEMLASAMREALEASVESLTAMGAAGRRRVLVRHDAMKEAQKLKELIERRINSTSESGAERRGLGLFSVCSGKGFSRTVRTG